MLIWHGMTQLQTKICCSTPCIIHLENLAAQNFSPELNDVMIGPVKIIKNVVILILPSILLFVFKYISNRYVNARPGELVAD